jgi:beta-mannosidase
MVAGLVDMGATLSGTPPARAGNPVGSAPPPVSVAGMELGGSWQAVVADDDRRRTWMDDDVPAADAIAEHHWEPVSVPGHWRNHAAFADVDGPLLYRTRFEHPAPSDDERLWLRFEGLFYQGDVWLDGGYVGDTEGYFFPHTFEVTEPLRERSEHLLGVEVSCSPQRDRSTKRNITGVFQDWNCGDPDANPGGIWRPVHIERTGPVRIRHLRVLCRDASESRANVRFRAVLDAAEATEATLCTTIGEIEVTESRRLAAGENQVEWTVRVDQPDLWWPHLLGAQPLHEVAVEVTAAGHDEPSHRVLRRIGLREVHLKAWILHVNGERLFVKGTNLGPTRTALADATPEELARDIALAKDANLDLVRVHGHITRPELYDAADEAGMLVWQDFPLQWSYARSIRKQAQRQAREAVDLLGHHPSVAVWCAHNEPFALDNDLGEGGDVGAFAARYLAAQELPSWNKTILDRSVKRAIDKADGTRPVIAHSGVLPHPPLLDGTDSHLYFGWYHGDERDLAGLSRLVPRQVRFVSEFGAQAVPESAGFASPERWPDLDWVHLGEHHGLQKAIFDRRVPPADHPSFESWRAATQTYQAELLRHHVETLRRIKYRPTGGFAQFLLADPHPAISWSVLDHERIPKAGYAALRDACRPVIVVADRLPAEVVGGDTLAIDVHVISDLREELPGVEVLARLTWAGGEQRWRFGGDLGPDSCELVGTLAVEVPDAPGPLELVLELVGDGIPQGPVTRLDRSRIAAR